MEELYNEADTRAKLIDPALHQRGWSEDKIKREETPGAVDVVDGKPRKRAHGRIDYTLRARVNSDTQPVALAFIEAKSEQFSPGHGLQQGKEYADATKRLNVQFVFSTNGHRVVEYDRITGETTDPYAFKCTAASGGSDYVADLRGASRHHFIATTVDLLSTGVDVPSVKNIVFFKYVRSPIAFYQMVGRGTRLDPVTNKLMFRIYDYTNATRLFGEDFQSRIKSKSTGDGGGSDTPTQPTVIVEGLEVQVTDVGKYILKEKKSPKHYRLCGGCRLKSCLSADERI